MENISFFIFFRQLRLKKSRMIARCLSLPFKKIVRNQTIEFNSEFLEVNRSSCFDKLNDLN